MIRRIAIPMKQVGKHIAFVSTGGSPWGGSEELWSQTALRLACAGVPVAASVLKFAGGVPKQVERLIQAGVQVQQRESHYGLFARASRRMFGPRFSLPALELAAFLRKLRPALVVFSDGGLLPPIGFLELCITNHWPFATIGHGNFEYSWLDDALAERYRATLTSASRCFFVSKSSVWLAEKQIGCVLQNSEVIHNPFNVKFDARTNWPSGQSIELSMACVGSLHPGWKGQDVLFEALATPSWRGRSLAERVTFAGHVSSIENIWANNHLLVHPSRSEGMPLSVIEAMLCGRPVVATNIAGHSEIIEDGISGFLADAPTKASLARTLEMVWEQRATLETMGQEAAARIRRRIPADPAGQFFEKLQTVAATAEQHAENRCEDRRTKKSTIVKATERAGG
jgi:hypothetical protein